MPSGSAPAAAVLGRSGFTNSAVAAALGIELGTAQELEDPLLHAFGDDVLQAFGFQAQLLDDAPLVQNLVDVRDAGTGNPIDATFRPATKQTLALEPDQGGAHVLHAHHREHRHEQLELQACHPRFFASHRYLVYARLMQIDPRGGPPIRPPARTLAAAPLASTQG